MCFSSVLIRIESILIQMVYLFVRSCVCVRVYFSLMRSMVLNHGICRAGRFRSENNLDSNLLLPLRYDQINERNKHTQSHTSTIANTQICSHKQTNTHRHTATNTYTLVPARIVHRIIHLALGGAQKSSKYINYLVFLFVSKRVLQFHNQIAR